MKKFVILFIIRFHQTAKKSGLSSLNMCYLLLADALNGEPISKTRLAEELSVSRAGIDKMMEKTKDLIDLEKNDAGQFRLLPTEKGRRLIGKILGGL